MACGCRERFLDCRLCNQEVPSWIMLKPRIRRCFLPAPVQFPKISTSGRMPSLANLRVAFWDKSCRQISDKRQYGQTSSKMPLLSPLCDFAISSFACQIGASKLDSLQRYARCNCPASTISCLWRSHVWSLSRQGAEMRWITCTVPVPLFRLQFVQFVPNARNQTKAKTPLSAIPRSQMSDLKNSEFLHHRQGHQLLQLNLCDVPLWPWRHSLSDFGCLSVSLPFKI